MWKKVIKQELIRKMTFKVKKAHYGKNGSNKRGNSNMPKLSTPFSHIRSPVKPKEEITNPFITELSHQENDQALMKEAPQLKEWPTFTGEGEYDHMSLMKTIDMLQEDYAIPDKLITSRFTHYLRNLKKDGIMA
ncbi:hypothetical protein O181_114796 [Austropuccinia psidii MF-1]|uniref:Uncharacterized protein n=1 Tax=Austropuccinia psidii MF-1 TaxID=1389203 RepID=A0A9Q3K7J2_9BASI|nr:hypothetical protein [Austropuccinia psidii MF-1]